MMKVISERWKYFMLNEGMRHPEQLPDDVFVGIFVDDSGEYVKFQYVDEDGQPVQAEEKVFGTLEITKEYTGQCLNAWMIEWSSAAEGWGPLLYDIAMEWTTMRRSGLMSDRNAVSDKAYKVWSHYLSSRSDIVSKQLDNLANDLTPQEIDNCAQVASEKYSAKSGTEWHKAATSKIYMKKDAKVIRKLQSLGKLFFAPE